MTKKKKVKEKDTGTLKAIIFVFIIIFVFVGICVGAILIINEDNGSSTKKVEVHKNLNTIEGYGINIDDDDTDLYKLEFEKLKSNLEGNEIDYEEYAKSIAKLFIIDVYTISNKNNKYDVGGTEFVLPSIVDNYKLNIENTLYKYLNDNSQGTRDQMLPTVTSISVSSCDKTTYEIKDDKKYDAYKIKLTWDYKNDYEYDKSATVIVINKDNKLYVVEKN